MLRILWFRCQFQTLLCAVVEAVLWWARRVGTSTARAPILRLLQWTDHPAGLGQHTGTVVRLLGQTDSCLAPKASSSNVRSVCSPTSVACSIKLMRNRTRLPSESYKMNLTPNTGATGPWWLLLLTIFKRFANTGLSCFPLILDIGHKEITHHTHPRREVGRFSYKTLFLISRVRLLRHCIHPIPHT